MRNNYQNLGSIEWGNEYLGKGGMGLAEEGFFVFSTKSGNNNVFMNTSITSVRAG